MGGDPFYAALELEHAIGCSASVKGAVHLHPNGRDMVCAAGGAVVVTALNDPHQQALMSGHDDFITCIALSREGHLIASGQQGNCADVLLWDVDARAVRYRWQEHDHGISCLAFTRDDAVLISVGNVFDKRAFVWDCNSGLILAWHAPSPDPTTAVIEAGMVKDIKRRELSQYQFICLGGQKLNVWQVDTGTGETVTHEIQFGSKHVREFTCLCMSLDYELAYAGSTSGDIVSILMKNSVVQAISDVCTAGVHTVSMLREREATLIAGGGDGTISILTSHDQKAFQIVQQIRLDGVITSVSQATDGVEALVCTASGSLVRVRLHDLSFTVHSQIPTRPVHSVYFPHGLSDQFLSAGADGVITAWENNDYTARLRCYTRGAAPAMCVTGTQDILVAGYLDGKLRSFDMYQGSLLWDIEDAHKGGVNCIEIARNARFILTGGKEGELRVWELRTREMVSHLKEHSGIVNTLQLFENDRYGISASRDHQIFTWDLQAEKRLTTHREKHGGVNSLVLLEDQTTVLSAGQERIITMWDLRQQDHVYRIQLEEEVMSMAYTTAVSGGLLATGGTDKCVKLWDPRNLTCGQKLTGHSQPIESVAFSADGRQIVSAGYDQCLFVWNVFPFN
jgi:WD40 repeat protein